MMANDFEKKNVQNPDRMLPLQKATVEAVQMDGGTVLRYTMDPGWRWTEHLKPMMGTDLCEIPHFAYQISGKLRVAMRDGTEFDVDAGDVHVIPAGHDAWVVGDEPVVGIDWAGVAAVLQRPPAPPAGQAS
jgi:quercetin dioxygenase-like cupin family protein